MSIADKLTTIAENEQKIYNKGGLDVSPQESVSGEAICITDISPIEHNMGVSVRGKQLITPLNTVVTTQGFTFDSSQADGSTIISGVGSGITVSKFVIEKGFHDLLIDGETYTFAMDYSGQKTLALVVSCTQLSDNKAVYYSASQGSNFTNRFTVDKSKYKYDRLYFQINANTYTYENEVVKPILALGSYTSLPFVPYIEDMSTVKLYKSGEDVELTIYDVSADGTVEGVKSIYPNTTLYTDTEGVVIDCTYYQDGKKVKENLTDLMLSPRGATGEVIEK